MEIAMKKPTCRILIIDDNYDLASILGLILESEEHTVDVAYSREQGNLFFYANTYDLVLIDVKLPDGNGIKLAHEYNQHAPHCPIIIMTGYRIEQMISEIMDNGTVSILHRSFNTQQLINRVKSTNNEHIILALHPDPDIGDTLNQQLNKDNISSLLIKQADNLDTAIFDKLPEVIISDLGIPIFKSIHLYLQLKKQGITCPYIITLPYNSKTQTISDVLQELDSTGCLFKPFDPDILLSVINTISCDAKRKARIS
jgi:DNA-binding response OmpR family regulator